MAMAMLVKLGGGVECCISRILCSDASLILSSLVARRCESNGYNADVSELEVNADAKKMMEDFSQFE
jgi:hypothetical protein